MATANQRNTVTLAQAEQSGAAFWEQCCQHAALAIGVTDEQGLMQPDRQPTGAGIRQSLLQESPLRWLTGQVAVDQLGVQTDKPPVGQILDPPILIDMRVESRA